MGLEMDEMEGLARWWEGRLSIVEGLRAARTQRGLEMAGGERRGRVRRPWVQRAFERDADNNCVAREQCVHHARRPPLTLPAAVFGQDVQLCGRQVRARDPSRLPPAMAPTLPATPSPPAAHFQLALPSLLASISPSLAALHATRARLLLPPHVHRAALADTHCARCGYPRLLTDGHTRSLRKKRKRSGGPSTSRRVLRRSCGHCGHAEDVPLAVDDAPTFPMVRDRAKRKSPSSTASQPRAPGAAHPAPATLSSPSLVPAPSLPRPSHPIASCSQSSPMPSRTGSAASSSKAASSSLTSSPAPSPSPRQAHDQVRPKSRPKKNAGLQSMLARNRERQEQQKKHEGSSSGQGLSAFLQGL